MTRKEDMREKKKYIKNIHKTQQIKKRQKTQLKGKNLSEIGYSLKSVFLERMNLLYESSININISMQAPSIILNNE